MANGQTVEEARANIAQAESQITSAQRALPVPTRRELLSGGIKTLPQRRIVGADRQRLEGVRGEVRKEATVFERQVARYEPEKAKPQYIEEAYEEAKSKLQSRIEMSEKEIAEREARINKKLEDRRKAESSEEKARIKKDINEEKAEINEEKKKLRELNRGITGDRVNVVKKFFSGETIARVEQAEAREQARQERKAGLKELKSAGNILVRDKYQRVVGYIPPTELTPEIKQATISTTTKEKKKDIFEVIAPPDTPFSRALAARKLSRIDKGELFIQGGITYRKNKDNTITNIKTGSTIPYTLPTEFKIKQNIKTFSEDVLLKFKKAGGKVGEAADKFLSNIPSLTNIVLKKGKYDEERRLRGVIIPAEDERQLIKGTIIAKDVVYPSLEDIKKGAYGPFLDSYTELLQKQINTDASIRQKEIDNYAERLQKEIDSGKIDVDTAKNQLDIKLKNENESLNSSIKNNQEELNKVYREQNIRLKKILIAPKFIDNVALGLASRGLSFLIPARVGGALATASLGGGALVLGIQSQAIGKTITTDPLGFALDIVPAVAGFAVGFKAPEILRGSRNALNSFSNTQKQIFNDKRAMAGTTSSTRKKQIQEQINKNKSKSKKDKAKALANLRNELNWKKSFDSKGREILRGKTFREKVDDFSRLVKESKNLSPEARKNLGDFLKEVYGKDFERIFKETLSQEGYYLGKVKKTVPPKVIEKTKVSDILKIDTKQKKLGSILKGVSKTKQITGLVSTPLVSSSTSTKFGEKQLTKQKLATGTLLGLKSVQRQTTLQRSALKQKEGLMTAQTTRLSLQTRQVQKQRTLQKQKLIQRNGLKTKLRQPTPPSPTRILVPEGEVGFTSKKEGYKIGLLRKRVNGFNVLIKSPRKKYIKVNKVPLEERKAKDLGAYVTDRSLGATFKIVPTKSIPKKSRLNIPSGYFGLTRDKFRDYKIVKGKRVKLNNTYIEKRGKRLDTPEEVKKITVAKKMAELRKKRRKFGGLI